MEVIIIIYILSLILLSIVGHYFNNIMKLKINEHIKFGSLMRSSYNGKQILNYLYGFGPIININIHSSNYEDKYVNASKFHLTKNVAENSNISSLSTTLYLILLKEFDYSSNNTSNVLSILKAIATVPIIIFAILGLIFQSENFIIVSAILNFICVLVERRFKFPFLQISKTTIADFLRKNELKLSSQALKHLQRLASLKKSYIFFMSIFNPLLVNMYYLKILFNKRSPKKT